MTEKLHGQIYSPAFGYKKVVQHISYKPMPSVSAVIEQLKRFPESAQLSNNGHCVYTIDTYGGECCFDMWADELPDWSKPDVPTAIVEER